MLKKSYPHNARSLLTAVCLLFLSSSAVPAFGINIELQPSRKIAPAKESGETGEVRIAQQYGMAYLPLMIMRQNRLIERRASAAGLGNIKVLWSRFPSGKVMNDALSTGFLDFASGGVVPLLKIWDRSRVRLGVKGVTALSSMPLYLNTRNPKIRSLKDFTSRDRIAVPVVEKSIQAVILQMAAAQTFGARNYAQLDRLTVSMAHPQAREALLSDESTITAHFASPPYQYQELRNKKIRRVLSSYEVLGGPATFTVVWSRAQFRTANPRTYRSVYDALREAIEILRKDRRYAADVFIQQANSAMSTEVVSEIIAQPQIEFTSVPRNIMKYARFLHSTGQIKHRPANWKEIFFREIHEGSGN